MCSCRGMYLGSLYSQVIWSVLHVYIYPWIIPGGIIQNITVTLLCVWTMSSVYVGGR